MKRIHIVPIDEASKPKPSGKAFLLPGSYSPYTIGHHEMARQAAAHAASTGHTHFYHGIGAASKQSADDPLTHGQKRSVIRSGHRDIAKEHKGMQFHTTEKEHVSPFHQVAHLARQGHKHITIGLGSDQMKEGGVKTAIERHVKKYGGILDKDGKVHKATVSFHQMGAERHEGDMPRHEVLARLRKGDMSVAKAGRLRKAVASGDTELAHELMPKHINKPKYFSLIQKQQARVAKPKKKALVAERYISFLDFISEAPEIDPYIEPSESEYPHKYDKHFRDGKKQHVYDPKNDRYVGHRNLGEIHPGYELHRHTMARRGIGRGEDPVVHFHRYTIVHKKSKDVAGEIDATAGKMNRKTGEHRPGTGKGLKIEWVGVHSDHSSKKAGKSLAVAAYKHLHSKGHSIKSDVRQSYGGAHVWDKMRHDPDVKDHVKFHDQLDNKATPAHELSHGRIWKQDQSGQESTLVLHAKPKKKALVKEGCMSFLDFIGEDIELTHSIGRNTVEPTKHFGSEYLKKKEATTFGGKQKFLHHKNLGEFHPNYELHRHSYEERTPTRDGVRKRHIHDYSIVHKPSNTVVGGFVGNGGKVSRKSGFKEGKGDDVSIINLHIHPTHSKKKIGASLPVQAYKHLHKLGHSVESGSLQSPGGAHVWNTLRKDPEVKKHVRYHDPFEGRSHAAHKLPTGEIWQDEQDDRTLILHRKPKNKPKKKTVKEDIEMADVSQKPTTSKHALRWKTRADLPKSKASRLTKGYTIHTFHGPHDSPKNPVTQYHTIVHDASGDVVGELETARRERGGNMEHAVTSTRIHADHTQKKIGKSLALAAYKHLAKTRILSSSILQSPGGASVWNRLRKDPKLKGRVFHHSTSGVVPAHDIPDKMIWAHETKVTKSKGTPESLPPSKRHASEHSKVLGSRLTIRPLQKS